MAIIERSALYSQTEATLANENLELEHTNCAVCGSDNVDIVATGADYLHKTSRQIYTFARCRECSHIYLNNRPCLSEIARLYPSDYGTYTKKFARPESIFSKVKDSVLMGRFRSVTAGMPKDFRLLDVGCGDTRFLMAIRRIFPEANLSGLDWHFGPEIEKEAQHLNISTITGSIETANLPHNHYDVITMNQLIEHVWDVDIVLSRCYDSLKSGGMLSIETPNPDGWDRIFFKSGGWGGYYWPRHLNLFSSANLSQVVERAGFKVVSRQNLLAPPCWIYSIQFSAQRFGLGKWVNKVFADNNVAFLAAFAVIDGIAKLFGATTSNQKLIAVKVSN